ncbi:MAG: hypothetical protein JOY80_01880 [Candidatus Dormibacteraeota bacterium]|nr:hypothetical protein [Candidatus Dormibacteraeota bacterium]
MPNLPDTLERQRQLLVVLEPLRQALGSIPGCVSNGIGLTRAAFERLRAVGGGPESVGANDITITVGFESAAALEAGVRRVDALLGETPHEAVVSGRIVAL